MDRLYFYERNGQSIGPVTINQLLVQGIQPTTLVWHKNITDWVAAATIPELAPYFLPQMPAVPTRQVVAQVGSTIPNQTHVTPKQSSGSVGVIIGIVVTLALGVAFASRLTPDSFASIQTEQNVPEEEIKEIGYAANHLHDADDDEASEVTEDSGSTSEEDAIESIDNDNGWLTIHYVSGRTLGAGLSDKKDWFFAYSPHFIVVHNERTGCYVCDIHNKMVTDGHTQNLGAACTGLRMLGDNILIDVDTGHSTHQEIYDKDLRLLKMTQSHQY